MSGQAPDKKLPARTWGDAALIVFGGGAAAIVVEHSLRGLLGPRWAADTGHALFVFIFLAYRPSWRRGRAPSA